MSQDLKNKTLNVPRSEDLFSQRVNSAKQKLRMESLERQRQDGQKFKASLGYVVNSGPP